MKSRRSACRDSLTALSASLITTPWHAGVMPRVEINQPSCDHDQVGTVFKAC
jgi:hypothetical protein